MSLQVLAQDMASRGRGPDTMLVHMAPKEVAGLQALAMAHGGSLTLNPQTGLPEAGFLKNLLPTLIGAGLMFATGGTAGAAIIPGLSNAATIGLGVGGFQALRTGSLLKGLMAGLGAYGGAGLMGGVMGAGTGAASGMAGAEAAGAGAAEAAAQMTPSVGGGLTPNVYDFNVPDGFETFVGTPTTPPVTTAAVPGHLTPQQLEALVGKPFTPPVTPPVTAAVAPPTTAMNSPFIAEPKTVLAPRTVSYEAMKAAGLGDEAIRQSATEYGANMKGFAQDPFSQATQNAMSNPVSSGIKAIVDKPSTFFTKDNLKYGAAALAPTMFPEQKAVDVPRDSEQYRYAYNPNRDMPPTRIGDVGEYRYFNPSYTRLAADGGLMDLPVERMSDRNNAQMMTANGGQMYAAGGISHLGDYSDGGRLLKGPGDGVSDSIPASIADKRPARLADGEFVVPARIVSELGNGSTDAGARKLYAMMDRVQKNRNKTVGKGKVAVDSRSEKLLPA
jgi:hypothetical protein